MKFAKELEQDLVPEWRIKYLNYKAGKKYVKSVSRAISRANGATPLLGRKGELPPHKTPSFFATPEQGRQNGQHHSPAAVGAAPSSAVGQSESPSTERRLSEQRSLKTSPTSRHNNYGSIAPSARTIDTTLSRERTRFELPEPAMTDSRDPEDEQPANTTLTQRDELRRSSSASRVDLEFVGTQNLPRASTVDSSRLPPPARLRHILSGNPRLTRIESTKTDHGMQALDQVRQREREFFEFLDSELAKVDSFYRLKEDQAGERLAVLRQQLHEMRNRRTAELAAAREHKEHHNRPSSNASKKSVLPQPEQDLARRLLIDPIKATIFKPGPNSKALSKMPQSPTMIVEGRDAVRDFIRRPESAEVPYRSAKRKLKLALQEFYRGLELLKSFALLNRTAFRKLNKKYDKAVNARPPYRYMTEKVNKAWFVNSDIVDGHIRTVEDLYARYFEKGNKKIAAGKLRRLHKRAGDESDTTFRNGLCIGAGLVFAVQGLVKSVDELFHADPVIRQQTSFLLQIYGGYFLMLFLFFLFCADAYLWTLNKVNYQFIFEFDARHQLDWRQLASFPSFFLMLFGVVFWLNFTLDTPDFHLYYPAVLIGVSVLIILFPAPVLWYKSRKWLAYAHYRLFFAGLFPVEFRDFFLGDMYCSLTYATCNVELFFCLYANYWNDPTQCNSSNSRLLGFFTALPPIWRALQCIRRYYDTKSVFPHLVNLGKYTMSILAAATLSLYRINGTRTNFALFVTFSLVNSIYCSIWDVLMDFSLLQPDARYRFLRDIVAIKRRWMYYVIMVIDPILRFGWIFYAIFTHDAQHSTIVSFMVAFAEILRRGMWALFRVENEHCTNVAQYKASRDTPLPYHLEAEPLIQRASTEDEEAPSLLRQMTSTGGPRPDSGAGPTAVAAMLAHRNTHESTGAQPRTDEAPESGLRRRRPELMKTRSIRNVIAGAHRQDFQKRRRAPEESRLDSEADLPADGGFVNPSDDDDDDDDDETGSVHDERMEIRRVEGLVRNEGLGAEPIPQ